MSASCVAPAQCDNSQPRFGASGCVAAAADAVMQRSVMSLTERGRLRSVDTTWPSYVIDLPRWPGKHNLEGKLWRTLLLLFLVLSSKMHDRVLVDYIKALSLRQLHQSFEDWEEIFQNVEHDLVKAVETKILKMSRLSDICTACYNLLFLNSCWVCIFAHMDQIGTAYHSP